MNGMVDDAIAVARLFGMPPVVATQQEDGPCRTRKEFRRAWNEKAQAEVCGTHNSSRSVVQLRVQLRRAEQEDLLLGGGGGAAMVNDDARFAQARCFFGVVPTATREYALQLTVNCEILRRAGYVPVQ